MAGQSVLITGASSGIGRALALRYAQREGVSLVLCGRSEERLKTLAEHCQTKGASVSVYCADVRDQQRMVEIINQEDQRSPLTTIIANAGISANDQYDNPEKLREIFDVNVQGVLNTILPAIPLMKKRGKGQLVFISSIAAFWSFPPRGAYGASKAAIRVLGHTCRQALASSGIRVTVVCPGFVKTPLTDKNTFKMPFMLSADKASRIIVKALDRERSEVIFPRVTYWGAKCMNFLPRWVSDAVTRRVIQK